MSTRKLDDPCENTNDEDIGFPPIFEKLIDDSVSMTSDRDISEITYMFKELSNYEGRLIDSDYEEYITGMRKIKRKKRI